MENRSTILNELREISPVLAQTYLQHPYQAPAAYFEHLPEQVLQKVKGRFYQVPEGYFESLANQLLKKVKGQVYEVPAGYFESLPQTMLNRVKSNDPGEELETLSPLLKQIGKKTPFSMPEGYFSDLSENAIAGAQALDFVQEELNSPLLDGLKNKKAYEVPAGYFEQLPGQLLKKVQPAKVVSMRFTKRILQYAAAAVVAGVIVMAGWVYLGNNTAGTTNGDLPPVVADNLEKIPDELLESYIENQIILPIAENTVIASADDFDANDMKEMLADVSDEDLERYIERYNTAKDIITN